MTARPLLLSTLIAAPLITLLGILLTPTTPDDTAGTLAAIADEPGRWLAGMLLSIAGQGLFVPAGLAVQRILGGRGSRIGAVGGVLLACSGVLHVGVLGYALAQLPLAEGGATSAAGELFGSGAFVALIVPTLATVYLGMVLIAVGVWRTGAAPRWVPVALVVAPALEFVADPGGTYATFALWTVAFAVLARAARESAPVPGSTPAPVAA